MKTQTLGAIEVHKLVEIERMPVDPTWLLGNITPQIIAANRDWLGPSLVEPGTDRLILSFHSYVIRTPGLTILIDTCNGNDKQRPSMPAWHMMQSPYLARLKALGLAPEDIDIVLCTHLHTDHVGWNTRLENGRWVPTFPNARYVMSRAEFAYFEAQHRQDPSRPLNRGSFVDSVLPVVEQGRAVMLAPGDTVDAALTDTLTLESAVGHSPSGFNIFLKAGGRRACFCGDVMHHAIQCAVPELCNPSDYDHDLSIQSRRALLEHCADTDIVMLTGHFPEPTAGRVVSHGDNFRFRFQD